jgi:putative MATE family efflux protein
LARTRNVDATEGNLLYKSLRIAWPAVIQAILVNFYAFNDFLFVGLLGDEHATAALSACFAIVVINYTLLRVIATGATTRVSQMFGEGNQSRLAAILRQAVGAEFVWSILVGIAGLLALPWIVDVSNAIPPVGRRIDAYLRIFYWSAPFFGLVLVVLGAFRACGNTKVPLAIECVSLGLNGLLNYLFVLGPGPFPSLGIQGAGIATAVSRGLPGVIGLGLILRGHLGFDLTDGVGWTGWRPRWARVRTMFRIGVFQSASGFIYGTVFFVLNRMAGEIGAAAQGGLGAGLRGIEWLGYATGDGFKTATMAVVGQNIGAGDYPRARRGAWINAVMSAFCCQLIGLAFLLAPETLSSIVTDDPATLGFAAQYVHTIGWVMWAVGLEMSMYGALIGSGRTHATMMISGGLNLLRVPIAATLLFGAAHLGGALQWSVAGLVDAPSVLGGFSAIAYTIAGTALLKATLLATYVSLKMTPDR